MSEVVTWIIGAVPIFAIFLFGAVGEIITEKSGHLNLGIPGIMCFGGMGGIFGIVLANNTLFLYRLNLQIFWLVHQKRISCCNIRISFGKYMVHHISFCLRLL